MYIEREIERKFLEMGKFFKAVLVTGARQTGKTTMLKHLAESNKRAYVSLDDIMNRELAQNDPKLFLQTHKPPILIDEVQKAPQLFEQIKIICDNSNDNGLFWLTGSQQFDMIKSVSESLAGRIGILKLFGLSQREKSKVVFDEPLRFDYESLMKRQEKCSPNNIISVFEHIWKGGMPQVVLNANEEMRREYYSAYVDTYLMRDAMEAGGITDSVKFLKFLKVCASLTGEQLNYSTIASSAGISESRAKDWIGVLQGLGIIYLLQPYYNNALKRLAKAPKMYFCDTGLCAYLSMWTTAETLRDGAASGHFFENYVVMELVKNYAYGQAPADLSYYRDSNAKEIDVIIETDGELHPLEIKKSANPNADEVKKFDCLFKTGLQKGSGGIVCMCDSPRPISDNCCFIPSNLI